MASTGTFLDVSTAHLTPATRDRLDWWGECATRGEVHDFLVGATAYGWFVSANPASKVGKAQPRRGAIPKDLWAIMTHAQKAGATHILFDRDGPLDPDLPTYDD